MKAQQIGKSLAEKLIKIGAGNLIEKADKIRDNTYGSAENPNLEARPSHSS